MEAVKEDNFSLEERVSRVALAGQLSSCPETFTQRLIMVVLLFYDIFVALLPSIFLFYLLLSYIFLFFIFFFRSHVHASSFSLCDRQAGRQTDSVSVYCDGHGIKFNDNSIHYTTSQKIDL